MSRFSWERLQPRTLLLLINWLAPVGIANAVAPRRRGPEGRIAAPLDTPSTPGRLPRCAGFPAVLAFRRGLRNSLRLRLRSDSPRPLSAGKLRASAASRGLIACACALISEAVPHPPFGHPAPRPSLSPIGERRSGGRSDASLYPPPPRRERESLPLRALPRWHAIGAAGSRSAASA